MSDISNMFCPNCGSEQNIDSKYCNNCGMKLDQESRISPGEKIKIIPDSQPAVASISNVESEDIDELQQAANYYSLRRNLVPSGVYAILSSIVFIFVLCYSAVHYDQDISQSYVPLFFLSYLSVEWVITISIVGSLFGLFLIVFGIEAIAGSSPKVLLFTGIGYFVLGWIVVFSFIWTFPGFRNDVYILLPWWDIFMVIPIAGAIDGGLAIHRYRRFSSMKFVKPPRETLIRVKSIIKPVMKVYVEKVKKRKDYIQINKSTFFSIINLLYVNTWYRKLGTQYCILAKKSGAEIFIARPEDFNISAREIIRPGKTNKVLVRIRNYSFEAEMGPISWQHYLSWQQSK